MPFNFTRTGDTAAIATPSGTSSSATSINAPANQMGGFDVLVTNDTDKTIFVAFGPSDLSAASATNGTPVKSGAIMVFGVGPKVTHVRAITDSGSATGSIYFTPGKGN